MSKRVSDPGYAPGWCIHFRDMSRHDTCEAGVDYDALAGGRKGSFHRLPCFIKRPDPHADQRVKCDRFRPPTQEEVALHEEWVESRMEMLRKVSPAVMAFRLQHEGRSHSEVIGCPVCAGRLHLSISGYNGHVHGRCETPQCVSWME